jgi:diguanylate cyclase (GGDEF)-like protein
MSHELPASAPKVLLVDDDPTLRLVLRHVLERDSYRVVEAVDGQQALEAFEREGPDVILLDAVMPRMNGFDVCRRLGEVNREAQVPILMITALNDERSIDEAFTAGASDYITKPIQYPILRQRVRRLLGARKTERYIEHLAYHDTLTGLPNRLLLNDRLAHALANVQRSGELLAVMFVDIDFFKAVNDRYGHDAGDRLLQEIAETLASHLREGDTVARLGGDEFVLLLPHLQRVADAETVARKVIDALSRPFTVERDPVQVSASVGIAVCPFDGTEAAALLRYADRAMYRAKELGRNNHQFYGQAPHADDDYRDLFGAVEGAVERGELEVAYQPVVDTARGRIHACEALLRWRHPQRGVLMPGSFLPLAESSGAILGMGRWLLASACGQAHAWHAAGCTDLRVIVNLSSRQFRDPGLLADVEDALETSRLPPRSLVLEVSETTAMQNLEVTRGRLQAFLELGVAVNLDDVGTGLSSLSAVARLPLHALKVDNRFVAELPDSRLVEAVVALARALGLEVVAEGVETQAQYRALRAMGCTLMQGYLFHRPLAAGCLAELLAHPQRTARLAGV